MTRISKLILITMITAVWCLHPIRVVRAAPALQTVRFLHIQTFITEQGGSFGRTVDGIGDLNGDNLSEIVVGVIKADPGGLIDAGSALIYSGADGTLLKRLDGENAGDWFGASVDAPGDLDGDGVPDIVVGAPLANTNSGAIYAYSGFDYSRIYKIDGEPSYYSFGIRVESVPDADGDGVRELLVSRPASGAGYVDVLSGVDGDLLHSLGPYRQLGALELNGSSAGDFDGDGVLDWAVFFGNYEFESGDGYVGAHVYSGVSGDQIYASPVESSHTYTTGIATSLGDLDSDGYDDLWVGAGAFDCGSSTLNGGIRTLLGPSGDPGSVEVCGEAGGDYFGHALVNVGDLNSDSFNDFAVGAPYADPNGISQAGSIYLVSGADGTLLDEIEGDQSGGYLGVAMALVGDTDGDGFSDLAVISFQDPELTPVIHLYSLVSSSAAYPYVTFSANQGFDTCSAPSRQDMQILRDANVPYKYIGIYFGGDSIGCSTQEFKDDPAWLTDVYNIGWKFILVWANKQAPCRESSPHRFSEIAAEAYDQGLDEAQQAVAEATRLGLTDPSGSGTIIYADLETFDIHSDLTCRSAAKAFLEGWVTELHSQGNLAGLYTNPAIAKVLWEILEPGDHPDVFWAATHEFEGFNSDASVMDLKHIPNEYWDNHQRLNQYAGNLKGAKDEWEGVAFNTYDLNIADGPISVPASSALGIGASGEADIAGDDPLSVAFQVDFEIHDMDLLGPDDGWVWVNDKLLWTETGGEFWWEITPRQSAEMSILGVYFFDTSHGWVMSRARGEDTVTLSLSRTNDRGSTWQTDAFGVFDLYEAPTAAYFDFLGPPYGWMVVKLDSSSNFSVGKLYKTTNGGETWSEHSIPFGNPVRLVSPLRAFTLGGPAHDALYVTEDGGTSWQVMPVIPPGLESYYMIYNLPTFSSSLDGLLPVIMNDLTQTEIWFLATDDMGASWSYFGSESVARDVRPVNVFPIEVVDPLTWVLPTTGGLQSMAGAILDLSFDVSGIGWAYAGDSSCSLSGENLICQRDRSLLATDDYGATWDEIWLPLDFIYLPLITR